MTGLLELIRSEPVRLVAAVQTSMAVAVLFGAPVTEAQLSGVVVAFAAWLAFFTRNQVTPNR